MKVAVIGVMRRSREDNSYEDVRKQTNKKIQEELIKMKIEWMKEKKGNINFIDLDSVLGNNRFYERDGVHFSDEGNARMGRRFVEWVQAGSLRFLSRE